MNTGQEILDRDILPRLFTSLDSVFPEFGWKRTRGGWVARNTRFTKAHFGARADRCVAKMQAGFLVYGDRSYHWLEYLNGGVFPRGSEWWSVVGELGARVGVALPASTRPVSLRSRMVTALAGALVLTPRVSQYLSDRAATVPDGTTIGEFTSDPMEVLAKAGFSRGEIEGAGVVPDGRWARRACAVWLDHLGKPASIWGRTTDEEDPKYLVLAGGSPPLFGAEWALTTARRAKAPWGVVCVEGMFDQLSLRAGGIGGVGLGRSGLTVDALRVLESVGSATLLLDADSAGDAGTCRSIEAWAYSHSPVRLDVAVLEGDQAKDPDELMRIAGIDGITSCLSQRCSAAVSYIREKLSAALTERDVQEVARRAVPFLSAVGVCHPLDAAAATDELVRRGASSQVLKLVSRQLDADELRRLRDSLAMRLEQVEQYLSELEVE